MKTSRDTTDRVYDERAMHWLRGFLERFGAIAGTVHVVAIGQLSIAAAINIPASVQAATAVIPLGKGMAGLAWQHDKPIQTCNLKTDETGAVKPGAKAVEAQAAVALPVHDHAGAVRAVVGLAWMDERALSDDQIDAIRHDAEMLPG